jgi:hypothetical protein
MLKELTRSDWLKILNIPEVRIPAALILRGTRNLRSQYQAVLPFPITAPRCVCWKSSD